MCKMLTVELVSTFSHATSRPRGMPRFVLAYAEDFSDFRVGEFEAICVTLGLQIAVLDPESHVIVCVVLLHQ